MKKMSARNFFYKKLYCVVFSLQSAALLVFFWICVSRSLETRQRCDCCGE